MNAQEKLEELKNNGEEVYSISRLDAINNCLYASYFTYVLHDRGKDNVYSALGSATHECLEEIVNGIKTEEDLIKAVDFELENIEILGLEFPKDRNGEDTIKDNWVADMKHFCETYSAPKNEKLKTEELFLYQAPNGKWLQGFIDLQRINADGSIDIYDYKTSSMYKGEELKKHQRQLILYALGKEQQDGCTINSVNWNFLKYANVEFLGFKTVKSKNKTEITKVIERRKIGSEMAKFVERDLADNGFDEVDIDVILHELRQTNKFDCLPDCIRDNYKIKPCIVSGELTQETRQECIEYIENTIGLWEFLNENRKSDFPPRKFTKTNKQGIEKPDYFFCVNLCSHFDKCEYIQEYLDTLQEDDDEEDLF